MRARNCKFSCAFHTTVGSSFEAKKFPREMKNSFDVLHNQKRKKKVHTSRQAAKLPHSAALFFEASGRLCECFWLLEPRRTKRNTKKEEKIFQPTFILKLLFAFVQTVAFQTSLGSYGSRRSSCSFFFVLCFTTFFEREEKQRRAKKS